MEPALLEVYNAFRAECNELLEAMEQNLLQLEARKHYTGNFDELFRSIHTVKGNAQSLGLRHLARISHRFEDVLQGAKESNKEITSAQVSVLLEALDFIRLLANASGRESEDRNPENSVIEQKLMRITGDGAPDDPSKSSRAYDTLATTQQQSLRVDIKKLDTVIDLFGEFSIARGRLHQHLSQKLGEGFFAEINNEVDHLYTQLHEAVLQLRMVPLGSTFRQLKRTVREAAALAEKEVTLKLIGEDVEIDARVLEHLRAPLVHLVRNAVDHGVESSSERVASGKDSYGLITLEAHNDGGYVAISCSDDGRGFDLEKIRAKHKLTNPSLDTERMTEAEVLNVVMQPGFSTTTQINALSGRGVGMDVISKQIDALHGNLRIDNHPGAGVTITARIPLAVSIIAGFAFSSGGETFILPMDGVLECLSLPQNFQPGETTAYLDVRGEALPLLRLSAFLGLPAANAQENAIIVNSPVGRAGLIVDQLFGESQAVIKPLHKLLTVAPGITASAILASGRVALVLEPNALTQTFLNI